MVAARTKNVDIAALANVSRRIYALQFHPEVAHTEDGERILHNFLFDVAGLTSGWTMSSFLETELASLKEKVGDDEVVCALSGGVDSTVVAVMLHKAIGKKLHCIFVDNGLLRAGERAALEAAVVAMLQAETGRPPDPETLLAGGYEALRPCLAQR